MAGKPTTQDPADTTPSFSLGGNAFHAAETCPMGALVVYVRKMKAGDFAEQILAADDLIRTWLLATDLEAYDAALNRCTNVNDVLTAATELIEAVTSRPTPAPTS